MDTKWALKHVERVVSDLQELKDSGSSLYNKSKSRLIKLSDECSKAVSLISDILQINILEDESTESIDVNVINSINQMKEVIQSLEAFVTPSVSTSKDSTVQPISTKTKNKYKAKANGSDLTVDQRKTLMANFKSAVFATTYSPYPTVAHCGKLISDWFETRFYKGMKNNTEYRYNIARIPEWICSIIIGYGKHMQNDTVSEYVKTFQDWFELVTDPNTDCIYSLPYEVFNLNGDLKEEDVSLHALVLYDLLLDSGLNSVCSRGDPYLLDPYQIYDRMIEVCNTTILDPYIDYKEDESILAYVGIAKEGEEENNND